MPIIVKAVYEKGVLKLLENVDLEDGEEVIAKYRLLPTDAQIAITCKHYNITTIATLDEDFKRIPWLKVVP